MMFTADWVGVGLSIAAVVFFLISIIEIFFCGDDAGHADPRHAWVAAAAPAPVPVAPVAQLGYFPYLTERRSASAKLVCAICLEVFEHGEECSEVPDCRHLFHRDCIGVWMKTKTTCPLCRRRIVTGGSERVSPADDMV